MEKSEQENFPTIESFVGNTPLVRLQRIPGDDTNLLLAKLEGNNPAGSVKDRPAISMIKRADGFILFFLNVNEPFHPIGYRQCLIQ